MFSEEEASLILSERYNLDVSVEMKSLNGNRKIIISPTELERTTGFRIVAEIGWRSINIKFIPGSFARELINHMESANGDQHAAYLIFAESLINENADLNLKINNQNYKPGNPIDWPANWKSLEISLRKVGIVFGEDFSHDIKKIFPLITTFFGLCISLLPMEPVNHENEKNKFIIEEEGTPYTVQTTRYERSSINRAACIEIHGTRCKVCSIDFREFYGEVGEGYIHVHHKIPLSEINESYTISPKDDLIPVCPNCHAMIHKRKPPYTIEEMSEIIAPVS